MPQGDQTQSANVVLTANTRGYEEGMDRSDRATQKVLASVVSLGTAVNNLAKSAGRGLEIVSATSLASLALATKSAADFQQRMSQLDATAIMTGRSFDVTTRQVNELRSAVGVSTDTVIGLVTQLNSLGQGGQNVRALGESFLRLSSVTGESVTGLTDGLIQLQRTMGTLGVENTNKYASALANVASNAGVSATGVLQFANAIAPIGKVAGMSQNEILGVSAAFQKSGADGYSAATAFNRMLTDITRSIQYGSPELGAYANLIGVTVDQFKSMPKTDAVTQIFEAINNQGPDAIKTLERFGLDGIRTYKALQAVAQSGGIGKSVREATEGYSDTTKFMSASDAAMNGLNESGQQLRNTLMQIGEAFGKAFIGPLTAAVNAINTVLTPIASLLSMLGSLPGAAALAGTAFVGFAGLALKNAAGLSALALARQVAGGMVGAGFQVGRRGANAPGWARNAAGDVEQGNASWARTQAFRLGNFMGGAVDRFQNGTPRPGDLPGSPTSRGFLSRVNSGAGYLIRGAGNFLASQYEPLWPSRINNPNMRDMPGSVMGRGDPRVVSANMQEARAGLRAFAREATSGAGSIKSMGSAATAFASSIMRAGVGAGMMGGNLMVRGGMGAMRGLAAGAGSILGGPAGIGMMTGLAAMGIIGHVRGQNEAGISAIGGASDINAAGGAYRSALGEAAKATMSFADVVNRAASQAGGGEFKGQIRASDISTYQQHKATAAYSDPALEGMDDRQLEVYAKSAVGLSPKAQELFMFDLLKKFGGDQNKAQRFLDMAQGNGGALDLRSMYAGIGTTDWMGANTDAANAAAGYSTATRSTVNAELTKRGGVREQAKYGVANLNALIGEAAGPGNKTNAVNSLFALAGAGTDEEKDAIRQLISGGSVGDWLNSENTDSPQLVYQRLAERIKSGQATGPEKMLWQLYSQSGLTGNDRFSTNYTMPKPIPGQMFSTVDSIALDRVRGTSLGGIAMQSGVLGSNIESAITKQGDANAAQIAMKGLADTAIRTQGGFSGAIGEIDRFKNAVGDVNDPLSQLAAAAAGFARQLQSEQMHYMTQQQRFNELQANYEQSRKTAFLNPNAPDAEANVEKDRQALEAARAQMYDRVANIALAYRNLEIQQKYGAEDLATSQARAREQKGIQEGYARQDFNTSRGYAEEDFARQRQRATESFWRQESRALFDFNLQRSRAEEDFNRQRDRNEAAYQRQLARQVRDYNRQRAYAYADYNRGRVRAEEDFNHQILVMTRQAARSMYDIYQRVNVQSTWSAENLLSNIQDQQKRLAEQQANLDRLRKMGLSGDAIQMLGLNDPANAQQLARFVDDTVNNPQLIQSFNKAITDRTAAAAKVVTDKDNAQWQEMLRSFNLNLKRGAEDFNTQMNRQRDQFNISLSDQRQERKIQLQEQAADFSRQMARSRSDFNRQIDRARQDFSIQQAQQAVDFAIQMARSATEFKKQMTRNNANFALAMRIQNEDYARQIKRANEAFNEAATDQSIYIQQYADKAAKALRGAAKTQFDALRKELAAANILVEKQLSDFGKSIAGSVADVYTKAGWLASLVTAAQKTSGAQSSAAADHYIAPTGNGTGGSPYGVTDGGSITQGYHPPGHRGIDIGVRTGTRVYAARPGQVYYTGFQAGGFGYHVRVDHGSYKTIYGHLSMIGARQGQQVRQGQIIGYAGSTGNSTGPHLHFEARREPGGLNDHFNPSGLMRRAAGGTVAGRMLGDRVPMLAESGEYVIPKFRVQEFGTGFFDALRASGIDGIKNAIVKSQGRVSEVATNNYYSRVDKSTTYSGDIHVHANDPRAFEREMAEKQRMKALIGRR